MTDRTLENQKVADYEDKVMELHANKDSVCGLFMLLLLVPNLINAVMLSLPSDSIFEPPTGLFTFSTWIAFHIALFIAYLVAKVFLLKGSEFSSFEQLNAAYDKVRDSNHSGVQVISERKINQDYGAEGYSETSKQEGYDQDGDNEPVWDTAKSFSKVDEENAKDSDVEQGNLRKVTFITDVDEYLATAK